MVDSIPKKVFFEILGRRKRMIPCWSYEEIMKSGDKRNLMMLGVFWGAMLMRSFGG